MSKKSIIFVFLMVVFVIRGSAQDGSREGMRTFFISWENDHFAGTDRGFTNGMELTWITEEKDNPAAGSFMGRLFFVNKSGFRFFRSYSVRQDMFTPDDLTRVDLNDQDRPYAGHLALELGAHSVSRLRAVYWGWSIGIVGPLSLAEQAQKLFHSSGRADWPEGWHRQLKNELAVQLYHENKWKKTLAGGKRGFGLDMIPHAGGGLGNVYTYAHAGFQMRLGWNLPVDFGVPLLRPGGSSGAGFSERDRNRTGQEYDGLYFYAAGDAQAVCRNIFLDGNTFRPSHSVEKEVLTGYLLIGLGFKISHLHVTFGYTAWSELFRTQQNRQIYAIVNIYYSI